MTATASRPSRPELSLPLRVLEGLGLATEIERLDQIMNNGITTLVVNAPVEQVCSLLQTAFEPYTQSNCTAETRWKQ